MLNKIVCIFLCCSLLFLSACWDMLEIEDRGFIVGTAIDVVKKISEEQYEIEVTNQLVIPKGMKTGTESGGGSQKAFINLSAKGKSIFEIDQEMSTRTSKVPYFEHLRLLVISEEVAKTPHLFASILDIFIRDAKLRRGIKVIVAKDKAKNLLKINPEDENLPSVYIQKLLEQSYKQSGLFVPTRIGDIQEYHLKFESYTLPIAHNLKNRIDYEGAAVFHGDYQKMIGSFTEYEMVGLNLLSGKQNNGGTLEFNYEGKIMTIEIEKVNNKIEIDTKDMNHMQVFFDVKLSGNIKEIIGSMNPSTPKRIEEIENAASKEIKKLTHEAIVKGQQELNADVFGIGVHLKTHHPAIWKKVENDWDNGKNYFGKTTIHVNANTIIDNAGTSKKTNKRKGK